MDTIIQEVDHPDLPDDGWWACQFPERTGKNNYKKHWRYGCTKCWIDLEAHIRQSPSTAFRGLYFKHPKEYQSVPFRDLDRLRQWWFAHFPEKGTV